ncbi:MAG: dihydropteroate synthase [Bacteroidales bacterium]
MAFIRIRDTLYDLSIPRIMGIVNITPDSFHSGSRAEDREAIRIKVAGMRDWGVDIIDVGGYSSRPGAKDVAEEEEAERVSAALEVIRNDFPELIVSVDTYRSGVAEMAVKKYGADIINDIYAGKGDDRMQSLISGLNIPVIVMHMKGTPANMQENAVYDDVVSEVIVWLSERVNSYRLSGVTDIIVDPGFGFGKKISHNFELMAALDQFSVLGCPVLAGISRKSMIWSTLGVDPGSQEALAGTIALNSVALLKGASVIRVHDVREAYQTVRMVQRVREA